MSDTVLHRWLHEVVEVRPAEVRALLWSFAYFFCLLAGYYVLRPLRDEMGIAGGVRNLQWLFTATFAVMLAAVPLFGADRGPAAAPALHSAGLPFLRRQHRDLLGAADARRRHACTSPACSSSGSACSTCSRYRCSGRSWPTCIRSEQGKRLFGFIAAGGSAGALAGPALTVWLAVPLGPVNLLIVAALLLEIAVLCARRLESRSAASSRSSARIGAPKRITAQAAGLGGGWLAGIAMVLRSPYLAGIALWVALLSLAGTFLYFQQANIVASASDDPAVRTRIFATIDLAVGILTILVQFLATGRLISRFGAGPAAAFLPVVFGARLRRRSAFSPALFVVIAFQAAQRIANFAVSNPAREVLFTVLEREEKYKAKNVIDIVVFRGADAASGWLFAALRGAGLDLSAIALATVPVAVLWFALALTLGRAQERRARGMEANAATRSTP